MGLLAALVLGTALGASGVSAQDTGAQQPTGAPGDAKAGDGQKSGRVRVTTQGQKPFQGDKPYERPMPVDDMWDFLAIEFGLLDAILEEARAEEEESDAQDLALQSGQATQPNAQQGSGQSPPAAGQGGGCIRQFTETDPKTDPQAQAQVDPRFKAQSALEGMADRLEELGLKEACRALRDLARKVREAPQTAGPAPISLWIQGRPPGGGPNPGTELAFDVSRVGAFQAAGVALLSNTLIDPTRWPGAVYAELDQPRKVAPAPGLDPAGWPATGAVPLSLTLEMPIP